MPDEIAILRKLDHPSFIALLRSDGIVHFEMKDIEDYTLDIIHDQTQFLFELGKGEKFPALLTYTAFNSPNEKTMKYAAKEGNLKYIKAIGVVVDSLALRLGVNFYLNFFKPTIPTKLFKNIEGGVTWLKKVDAKEKISALA